MEILREVSNCKGLYLVMCPGCDEYHQIHTENKYGPNWSFNGNMDKPTFSPSLLVNGDLSNKSAHRCHSFIRDGKWQFLGDCTHDLAGKTVSMINLD